MTQSSFWTQEAATMEGWEPTHAAAQSKLDQFVLLAGADYARGRNFDFGSGQHTRVSRLSPWIRHRLIDEESVLRATLRRHTPDTAEKFIQEVFWRGYFKGWLEHRPEVWLRYKRNLVAQIAQLDSDPDLAHRFSEATNGMTGLECFDAWAQELVATGYLHNHARMWFASIWIFTLRLPWELGADFFYRHLLDGDPASNTCSWRWVGGLHTPGKTYLARRDNIARYTDGRFDPQGLAREALPLHEPDLLAPKSPRTPQPSVSRGRFGLLITEEDCSPHLIAWPIRPVSLMALCSSTPRSLLPIGKPVEHFAPAAVRQAADRAESYFGVSCDRDDCTDWVRVLRDWVARDRLDAIWTPRLALGPVQKRIYEACSTLGLPLFEYTRNYDAAVWPHAKRGFFGLKKKIPAILADLKLT